MAKKATKNILAKDTVLSVKLAKKHPANRMYINGVVVAGYNSKNYLLPAGTDLSTPEIAVWFVIGKEIPNQKIENLPKDLEPAADAAPQE